MRTATRELRDWESAQDSTFQASLEKFISKSKILLKREDGTKIQVERNALSPEDVTYLQRIWSINNPVFIFGDSIHSHSTHYPEVATPSDFRAEVDEYSLNSEFLYSEHQQHRRFNLEILSGKPARCCKSHLLVPLT